MFKILSSDDMQVLLHYLEQIRSYERDKKKFMDIRMETCAKIHLLLTGV